MGLLWNLAVIGLFCFKYTSGQYFNDFDKDGTFSFSPSCGLADREGNWTVTGQLILASEYKHYFAREVHFRNGEYNQDLMCTLDLDNCGDDPHPEEIDSCWCSRSRGDSYRINMRRLARVEESSKALLVALPLENGCNPEELSKAVGIMPPVYNDREMVTGTYQVENSPPEVMKTFQNVSVCPNHYIDLRFCAYNLIPEYHISMKIDQTGRETTVTSTCLDMTHKFNFDNHTNFNVHIHYDENAWCPRTGNFDINFIERTDGCSLDGCIDEEKDTCEAGNGALPRQVANINHEGSLYHVLCDTETDGGNWILMQRRVDGMEDFYKNWVDYVDGFGDKTADHWLGLQKVHELCFSSPCELRIDLKYGGTSYYAHYASFSVGGASEKYALSVSGYSGDAGDAFTHHSGAKFTSIDNDNDQNGANCAQTSKGGWWYVNCHESNLNGWWNKQDHGQGINWGVLTGNTNSATFSEMKIKVATGASGNDGNSGFVE